MYVVIRSNRIQDNSVNDDNLRNIKGYLVLYQIGVINSVIWENLGNINSELFSAKMRPGSCLSFLQGVQ